MYRKLIIALALTSMLAGAASCSKDGNKEDPEAPDTSTSLTEGNRYANCFMIQTAGTYSFETKLVDGTEVQNITSADWLWSTCDNAPAGLLSNVSYKKGKIYFTATSTHGNALIAAFDKEGNIVWSWHVWITDKPENQKLDNGFMFMDRNMGSNSAVIGGGPATYGLKYQWGRKDPFYGGDTNENEHAFSSADGHVIFNPAHKGSWKTELSSETVGTVEYAIANPTTFIYNNDTVKDWLHKKNGYLWALKNSGLKTNYDPCPAGYMVPPDNAWKGVMASNTFEKDGGKIHTTESGVEFWWPLCGTRWGDKDAGILGYVYNNDGGQGIYWQNTTNMAGTNACCFYILNGSYTDAGHGMYRAHGCAVRCQYLPE